MLISTHIWTIIFYSYPSIMWVWLFCENKCVPGWEPISSSTLAYFLNIFYSISIIPKTSSVILSLSNITFLHFHLGLHASLVRSIEAIRASTQKKQKTKVEIAKVNAVQLHCAHNAQIRLGIAVTTNCQWSKLLINLRCVNILSAMIECYSLVNYSILKPKQSEGSLWK